MKRIFACLLTLALALSLAACGKAPEKSGEPVDLEALFTKFQESMPEMIVLDETTRSNLFGIDPADCAQLVTAICAEGMVTDEVWLVEAVDADALARVQALAEGRLQAKADETINYAPDQYAVVEKGVILTEGNYLALLVSQDVDTLKAAFEAAVK